MKHELESWYQHPFDQQTTVYVCICGYKISGRVWIEKHINYWVNRTENSSTQ